jgi:Gram-negative bacterial TonB protein C-terminal
VNSFKPSTLFVAIILFAALSCNAHDASAQTKPAGKSGKANAKAEIPPETGPPKWVALERFVPPTVPTGAVTAGVESRVFVDARVNPDGSIKILRGVSSTPPNPALEAAVKNVLGQWSFTPLTENCIPIEAFVQASVKFEIIDGMLKIYARRPPPSEVAEPQYQDAPIIANRLTFSQSIARQYPQAALKARAEARVYMIATVNPSSGVMASAETSFVSGDQPKFATSFTEAAQKAIQVLKFDPLPASANAKGPMKTCVAVVFSVANMGR